MKETPKEIQQVDEAFKDLLQHCNRSKRKESEDLIVKAFLFAKNAHKGVKRKSGEPYILHPIAVAKIVATEIGLGTKAVCAALLHDVVEDTHFTLEDIENGFGPKIAYMVDGLTKIGGIFSSDVSQQAENFKKILLTLSDDMRVILIKIADRLHNMRTLEHMPTNKQMKIASETLYIFAPLAHRLGLRNIRKELESLSLKYTNPIEYKEIERKLSETKGQVDEILEQFIKPIRKRMEDEGYEFEINGRHKSVFSMWRKMQKKKLNFEEVYDRLAVRIVFEPKEGKSEKIQCFEIYNIIAEIYRLKEDRTRDWINKPRDTGYEALHVTAMADTGDWVEVQIRSRRMDDVAERGIAAHWNYKEGGEYTQLDKWLAEIRVLFENPDSDALSFLDDFKLGLYYDDIQVFTPRGDVHTLPKGATVLDFAYKIHTEIGNKCIGGKVNRRAQAINYELHSGDQVEVLTSEIQQPKEEWLNFVVTPRAKSKLKSIFRQERRERIKYGQELLEQIYRKNNFGVFNSERLHKLIKNLGVKNKEQLYIDLATGIITDKDVKKAFAKIDGSRFIPYTTIRFSNPFKKKKKLSDEADEFSEEKESSNTIDKKKVIALRDDKVDDEYTIAKCCQPIPGDDVIGYVDFQGNVEIHKRKCERIVRISSRQGDRLVTAEWKTHRLKSFLAIISIEGVDRHGLVNEITNLISNDHDVNMKGISVEVSDGVFSGDIKLYVPDAHELNDVIFKISKIKGIISVRRKE
ncbi:GTP pyrophosphokinase [Balneicella halophila]|uniref:GTP pyrophosphokinase n=1 Tax=Balneicella halophila TaxID=1537566 RepID=A0A7L4UNP2_BALHA|nr:RelA/SpoT family protein [Balneicella halophila]PVX50085.1 GTP pyrophosphokinase [Balneicella halophila]